MVEVPTPPGPIVVVGDIMCDHYVWGDVERISPEAPVQVVRWNGEADRPGGAANAAMNLAALGCEVRLAGIVGRDAAGRWVVERLRAKGVDTTGVIVSGRRATTLKTRILARGQHVLRIDRESRDPLDAGDERRLTAAVAKRVGGAAGVLCSDYNKGTLTPRVIAAALASKRRPFSLVDPKGPNFGRYKGADLLTPNEKELFDAASDHDPRLHEDAVVQRRARKIIRRFRFPALLVTRGAAGMDLFETEGSTIRRTHIPAAQRHEVFDVTGAGDTVAAVLTLGAASGLPLADAARLANAAAGIVVGVVGTAVVDRDALESVAGGGSSQARSKVLGRAALAARLKEARERGAAIVFTSGVYDALSVADLRALQDARARGELLVVGLQGGDGGAHRRAELLAALRVVDYVTIYAEKTPTRLIRALRPDVVIPRL